MMRILVTDYDPDLRIKELTLCCYWRKIALY